MVTSVVFPQVAMRTIGQRVLLRFTAFNQRTTPQLNGEVSYVPADVAVDQKSGASFYAARITVPETSPDSQFRPVFGQGFR